MALIVTSALINDIRGKLNGSVFGQSQGGLVLRNKGQLLGARTSPQTDTIQYTKEVSNLWTTLNGVQLQNWNNYANFAPDKTKRLKMKQINGKSAFFRSNWYKRAAIGATVADPVFSAVTDMISTMTLTLSAGVLKLDNSTTNPAATYKYYVSMSQPYSQNITKKPAVMARVRVDSYVGSVATITANYTTRFGRLPTVGQFIYCTIIQVFPTLTQTPIVVDRWLRVS